MIDAAIALSWEGRIRRDVDRTLAEALGDLETPVLREILERSVSGGKRVRPLLAVLACCAAGGHEEDALPAAAAIELLHASSLVHDDIMDDAEMRRGTPAVHKSHGIPMGILAGDTLIALAYRMLSRGNKNRMGEIISVFSDVFLALCEGQCADVQVPDGALNDPAQHAWMVERKTARLIEACMTIGGLVATSDRARIEALGTCGRHLGFAYQAVDDLLDVIGDEAITGKPSGRDVHNGRQTYLTLAYPAPDALSAARAIVSEHTNRALVALSALPPSPACEHLAGLAHALQERMS